MVEGENQISRVGQTSWSVNQEKIEKEGKKNKRYTISIPESTYLKLLEARTKLEKKEKKGISFSKTIDRALELLLKGD